MKQILTSKALRKLLILSCLIAGLIVVMNTNQAMQSVSTNRCCETCDASDDPQDQGNYCQNYCGGINSCYYSCMDRVQRCWANCEWCEGTGEPGGSQCFGNIDCMSISCPHGWCDGYNQCHCS